jgi:hypothetical protein
VAGAAVFVAALAVPLDGPGFVLALLLALRTGQLVGCRLPRARHLTGHSFTTSNHVELLDELFDVGRGLFTPVREVVPRSEAVLGAEVQAEILLG